MWQEGDDCPSKGVLLGWLLHLDEADSQWVLQKWKEEKPHLYQAEGCQNDCHKGVPGLPEDILPDTLRLSGREPTPGPPEVELPISMLQELPQASTALPGCLERSLEATIVQFSTFIYYCEEDEACMVLDVMRIGNLSCRSEVRYITKDGSGRAGKTYVATSGTLVFEPGENEKAVRVNIIDDNLWDTTVEFMVELLKEGLTNATLGRYLYQARVKVMDNDAFPTNRYKDELMALRLENVPKGKLLIEYFKMNWTNPIVKKGSIKILVVGAFHNVYFLLKLFMSVYLVDYILKKPASELLIQDRDACLLLYMGLLLVPFTWLHYCDYREKFWKVGGTSRSTLQMALIRKFLNYSAESRHGLHSGDMILAMTTYSADMVHVGYANLLKLVRLVGQLFLILVFQIVAPNVFKLDKEVDAFGLSPLIIFPAFQFAFLEARRSITTRTVQKEQEQQQALIGHVENTVASYRLIADYNRRPVFEEEMQAQIRAYNGARTQANAVLVNNKKFSDWLTVIFTAAYAFAGGKAVLEGLPLGIFLANMTILSTIGQATGNAYTILLEMQRIYPSLEKVTRFINMQTDIKQRKVLNRYRRAMTKTMREELRSKGNHDRIPIDLMPIRIDTDLALPFSAQIDLRQGELISFVGPRNQGKSTLVKILGGVMLPEVSEGKGPGFFVPSHLRVLHVSSEALLFYGSLRMNLSFGLNPSDSDAGEDRIGTICRMLGVSDRVMGMIDSGESQEWGDVLSVTERQLLSLARAFIANPEVLLLQKPTMPFDEIVSKKLFKIIKDYVSNRGLAQDPATAHLRRPRTCLVTSSKILGVLFSHTVVFVSQRDGIIKEVSPEEVSEDMLA